MLWLREQNTVLGRDLSARVGETVCAEPDSYRENRTATRRGDRSLRVLRVTTVRGCS